MTKEEKEFIILEALTYYLKICNQNDVYFFNFFNNTKYSLDEYKKIILKLIKEKL